MSPSSLSDDRPKTVAAAGMALAALGGYVGGKLYISERESSRESIRAKSERRLRRLFKQNRTNLISDYERKLVLEATNCAIPAKYVNAGKSGIRRWFRRVRVPGNVRRLALSAFAAALASTGTPALAVLAASAFTWTGFNFSVAEIVAIRRAPTTTRPRPASSVRDALPAILSSDRTLGNMDRKYLRKTMLEAYPDALEVAFTSLVTGKPLSSAQVVKLARYSPELFSLPR